MARFCMASKRQRKVNVCRNAWDRAGASLVIITGLGQVVEGFNASSPSSGQQPKQQIMEAQSTSDRHALLDHVQAHEMTFHSEYARASMVGPNILNVSWGLFDGLVMIYRRTKRSKSNNDNFMWQSVATCAPTRHVLSSLQDVLDEMSSPCRDTGDCSIGWIYVTSLLPPAIWYGPEIGANPGKGKRQNTS